MNPAENQSLPSLTTSRASRRSRDLEGELLVAARAVFGEKGYDAVRVEDILKAAGVSRHSFYRLFESKADVFMRLLDGSTQELVAGIMDAVSRADEPARQVRDAIGVYFRWIVAQGAFWRVIKSQQAVPGSAAQAVRATAVANLRSLLRVGVRPNGAGAAHASSPEPDSATTAGVDETLATTLIAAIEGIGRELVENPVDEAHIERVTRIALRIISRTIESPGA